MHLPPLKMHPFPLNDLENVYCSLIRACAYFAKKKKKKKKIKKKKKKKKKIKKKKKTIFGHFILRQNEIYTSTLDCT